MSQPNINTPNSDLVSSLSQSQSYLSPNFLVILPGLTSSVRLCGVERCPAQQSEEEEEEGGLESVVGLGIACGLVLRLGLVSGLYKWLFRLFYLATVRQLNHVVHSHWHCV